MYGGSARELPCMALPAAFLTEKRCTGSHFRLNIARELGTYCRKTRRFFKYTLFLHIEHCEMQFDGKYYSYVKMA